MFPTTIYTKDINVSHGLHTTSTIWVFRDTDVNNVPILDVLYTHPTLIERKKQTSYYVKEKLWLSCINTKKYFDMDGTFTCQLPTLLHLYKPETQVPIVLVANCG